ncbi:MAG: hypothetical protein NTX13_21370 [Acidobacteria bacterium]|nr:hypothetical protein [Acidobacteriota bacterium]
MTRASPSSTASTTTKPPGLFARAAELDPASPVPHRGIAYKLGPNYNQPAQPDRETLAWQAIDRATRLLAPAPACERAPTSKLCSSAT